MNYKDIGLVVVAYAIVNIALFYFLSPGNVHSHNIGGVIFVMIIAPFFGIFSIFYNLYSAVLFIISIILIFISMVVDDKVIREILILASMLCLELAGIWVLNYYGA